MKNQVLHTMARPLKAIILAACFCLVGCLPDKKIVWSPDGTRAGVLAGDDFYLCNEQGELSPKLLNNVLNYAWLADSKSLVVTRAVEVTSWRELAAELTPEQLLPVTNFAQVVLDRIKTGAGEVLEEKEKQRGDDTAAAALLYLRENHANLIEAWARGHEDEAKPTVQVFVVQAYHVPDSAKALPGEVIAKSLTAPAELRPDRLGHSLAYVDQTNGLFVAAINGSRPATLLEPRVGLFTDWTPDGQSLVYIRALGQGEAQFGMVSKRLLFSPTGAWTMNNAPEDLAGLLFDGISKVRCLRDGRILFSGTELHLPLAVKDIPQRENVFVVDPGRQATVTRLATRETEAELPQKCWSFEVSPDEKRVAFAADDGRIVVMTLATGALDVVQPSRGDKALKIVPTWRNAEELVYAAVPEKSGDTVLQKPAIALWKAGHIRSLSKTWPEEVLEPLFK